MWNDTLVLVAVGVGASALLASLYYLASRTRPAEFTGRSGRLIPNKLIHWMIFLFMLAIWIGVIVVTIQIFPLGIWLFGPLLLFWGVMLVSTVYLLRSPVSHVTWDDTGVTGPRSTWFLPTRTNQHTLTWDEVTEYRDGSNGLIELHADGGRKLIWSKFYSGTGQFECSLAEKRPDLPIVRK